MSSHIRLNLNFNLTSPEAYQQLVESFVFTIGKITKQINYNIIEVQRLIQLRNKNNCYVVASEFFEAERFRCLVRDYIMDVLKQTRSFAGMCSGIMKERYNYDQLLFAKDDFRELFATDTQFDCSDYKQLLVTNVTNKIIFNASFENFKEIAEIFCVNVIHDHSICKPHHPLTKCTKYPKSVDSLHCNWHGIFDDLVSFIGRLNFVNDKLCTMLYELFLSHVPKVLQDRTPIPDDVIPNVMEFLQ